MSRSQDICWETRKVMLDTRSRELNPSKLKVVCRALQTILGLGGLRTTGHPCYARLSRTHVSGLHYCSAACATICLRYCLCDKQYNCFPKDTAIKYIKLLSEEQISMTTRSFCNTRHCIQLRLYDELPHQSSQP